MVWESLTKKVTFELRPKRGGSKQVNAWEKSIPIKENSKYKSLKMVCYFELSLQLMGLDPKIGSGLRAE